MPRRHSGKSTQPSQRQLRVAELVRHALAELLTRGGMHDEVLGSQQLTIPEVRFRADETFDEALRIDRLLASDKVRQDLDKR